MTATGSDHSGPLLEVQGLTKHFRVPARRRRSVTVQAVDGVDLELWPGQTLAVVGESGCGKSTLARLVTGLLTPTAGRVVFDGQDLGASSSRALRRLRRDIQMVFQDPYASLNPRMTVGEIVAEPLRVHGLWRRQGRGRVAELLEMVGLAPEDAGRFPHEFSGGQRQRIGIARALVLRPRLLVLDEPVSSLDVSIRAQIVNLLADLQRELGHASVFIAHDLSLVRHVADVVAVMYLGKIVESGSRDGIYRASAHPYTAALLSAVPVPDPTQRGRRERIVLRGEVPDPAAPPSGCRFRTRCWKADERCATEEPALITRPMIPAGSVAACHYPLEAAPLSSPD